ncbi:MAG: YbhB/YbcL family Raf kinase inhibitor-like protein [Acidimicrobiia bacterium]|nr:YbhB/YbcL family Raf kinase inhibitor-like protein [Acidimicrobiia bacterium]
MASRANWRLAVLVIVLLSAGCSDSGSEPSTTTETQSDLETGMQLTSTAFSNEEAIPERYTCDGADISPPLRITGIPAATEAMVLLMDDPDAPVGVWDHWVAYDIEPREEIPEDVPSLGTAGVNSWERPGYGGPCPPGGTHRYFFNVFALDSQLGLAAGATKADVLTALEGHVLAQATLMGLYTR